MYGSPERTSKFGDPLRGAGHVFARGRPFRGCRYGVFWRLKPQWAFRGGPLEAPGGDALRTPDPPSHFFAFILPPKGSDYYILGFGENDRTLLEVIDMCYMDRKSPYCGIYMGHNMGWCTPYSVLHVEEIHILP